MNAQLRRVYLRGFLEKTAQWRREQDILDIIDRTTAVREQLDKARADAKVRADQQAAAKTKAMAAKTKIKGRIDSRPQVPGLLDKAQKFITDNKTGIGIGAGVVGGGYLALKVKKMLDERRRRRREEENTALMHAKYAAVRQPRGARGVRGVRGISGDLCSVKQSSAVKTAQWLKDLADILQWRAEYMVEQRSKEAREAAAKARALTRAKARAAQRAATKAKADQQAVANAQADQQAVANAQAAAKVRAAAKARALTRAKARAAQRAATKAKADQQAARAPAPRSPGYTPSFESVISGVTANRAGQVQLEAERQRLSDVNKARARRQVEESSAALRDFKAVEKQLKRTLSPEQFDAVKPSIRERSQSLKNTADLRKDQYKMENPGWFDRMAVNLFGSKEDANIKREASKLLESGVAPVVPSPGPGPASGAKPEFKLTGKQKALGVAALLGTGAASYGAYRLLRPKPKKRRSGEDDEGLA